MCRIPTIAEILKEHKKALFRVYRKNGEEIFKCPLTASQVHEGMDKQYLGCTVSEVKIEEIAPGFEYIEVTLRW